MIELGTMTLHRLASVFEARRRLYELIIEVDGYYHTLPETIERDAVRTASLTAAGYRVVRFPEKTVRDDLHTVIDQIRVLAPTPNPNPFCTAQMGV